MPGHWEGDLLAGHGNSYIAALVEGRRASSCWVKVPGKDRATVVDALIRCARRLPAGLMTSLTELARHRTFTLATDIAVYFCDPQSPWRRGNNENTNGLLRQYFRKRVELSQYTQSHLDAVANRLNKHPRQTLHFRTPAETFDAYLPTQAGASTG